MRLEEAQVVHAPRERVFQTSNDYDAGAVFFPLQACHGRRACREHRPCQS